jgi:hypothetical protein
MALFVALGLLCLLVALAVAMAWQERSRLPQRSVSYGVEESVDFVVARLAEAGATHGVIGRSDVRRMLEWAVQFAQQPVLRPDPDQPAVVGGVEMAQFVQDRGMAAGHAYDAAAIFAVLDLQAEYLESIGAVGEPVTGEPAAGDEPPPNA